MSSGARRPFDGLFGDPAGTTTLAEHDLRRITRRAQRLAGRGGQSNGAHADMAEIRDRAEQDALARQIGEALRARDAVSARNLIEEAARLGYSHSDMLRAVEEQTQQDRLEQMDTVRRREADPGDQWPGDPEPYEFEEEWPEHEPR